MGNGVETHWRCFWGAVLTRSSSVGLARALAGHQAHAGLRWIPRENWHVTLCFFGDVAVPRVQQLIQRGRQHAWSGKLTLTVDGVRPFPSRRSALLAVCFDASDALSRWASLLGKDADAAGVAFDRRPLKPHLTLARSRNRKPITRPPEIRLAHSLVCDRICLFRSELGSSGARYHPLVTIRAP